MIKIDEVKKVKQEAYLGDTSLLFASKKERLKSLLGKEQATEKKSKAYKKPIHLGINLTQPRRY